MEKINTRHAISIGVIFSIGSLIISLGMNNTATWQTLITSFLLSLLLLIVYQNLLIKYPNLNLFEIIKLKYNNLFGNLLILIYVLLLTYNGVVIIYSFIDFITTINQSDFLSKELIMLINILLIRYVLKNSLLNMARFSQVVFILIITMIILLFIAGIGDIDFSNLLPLIFKNTENKTNILNLIVQPFLELTLLYNVFCKIKTKEKYKKNIFLIVSVISLIVLLVISIESIGLLGDDYYAYLNYPYYSAMSCINMSKIVIKIESLSLIVVYFSSFIKLVFIVYNAILGINIILNNKKNYYFPYLMFLHVLSLIMFDNIYEMMEIKCYYSLIFFTFIILIPILINMKNDKIDNKNIMQYT